MKTKQLYHIPTVGSLVITSMPILTVSGNPNILLISGPISGTSVNKQYAD